MSDRTLPRAVALLLLAGCTGRPAVDGGGSRTPVGDARLPIIDMHMHSYRADFVGRPPVSPATDDDLLRQTLAIMERRNVIAVTSGELAERWRAAAPDRFIAALYVRANGSDASVDEMRGWFRAGRYAVLGEIAAQYRGVAPDDPSLEPYWALAEELDVPVGIHIGPGPAGAVYLGGWEKYRARLYDPLQLEEVLVRHPGLRIYVMHAGWPMLDHLLALLWAHPQVHVDISGIVTDLPRPAFHSYLRRIVEAGFASRVMFGSDQMIWPELLERAIETIESADYLTPGQRRAILYDNAAHFLQLDDAERARHRRLGARR